MSSWYGRHLDNGGRHACQIAKALRNGGTRQKRTDTEITSTGAASRVVTFEGESWHATGS